MASSVESLLGWIPSSPTRYGRCARHLNPPRGLDSVVSLQHLDELLERKMTEIEHARSWMKPSIIGAGSHPNLWKT